MLKSIVELHKTKIVDNWKKEGESPAYSQSMKLLYCSCVCFLLFFLIAIIEVYYYPDSGIIDVGLPFGYFGLGICGFILISGGKFTIPWPLPYFAQMNIGSEHRQGLFELINLENKKLKRLEWALGKNGKWLCLSELG